MAISWGAFFETPEYRLYARELKERADRYLTEQIQLDRGAFDSDADFIREHHNLRSRADEVLWILKDLPALLTQGQESGHVVTEDAEEATYGEGAELVGCAEKAPPAD